MSNTKDSVNNISDAKALEQFEESISNEKKYTITPIETLTILEGLRFGYKKDDMPDSYLKFDENDRLAAIVRDKDAKFSKLDTSRLIKLPKDVGNGIVERLMKARANSQPVYIYLDIKDSEATGFKHEVRFPFND